MILFGTIMFVPSFLFTGTFLAFGTPATVISARLLKLL